MYFLVAKIAGRFLTALRKITRKNQQRLHFCGRTLCAECAHPEAGQALLLGLVFLGASAVVAFEFIRLARLVGEKTRVIHTADAAAYSTGVLHARLLNYDAYTNRALIANEMALAQWLSIGSWAENLKLAAARYQQKDFSPSMLQQAGLDAYLPYRQATITYAEVLSDIATKAKKAAQAHNRAKTIIATSQKNAHRDIALIRRQLQNDIVQANLQMPAPDIYGWHIGGHFQGIDETDARKKKVEATKTEVKEEIPFSYPNQADTITLLRRLAQTDSFLKARTWAIHSTSKSCPNKQGAITRHGSTDVNIQGWLSSDTLQWRRRQLPQSNSSLCAFENTTLSAQQLSNASWLLQAPVPLRTLSASAQALSLPRHSYRFRIRHRFKHVPPSLKLDARNDDSTQDEPVENETPNTDIAPGLIKKIRTDVDVYFRDPTTKKEKKGDLFHPYWHIRLAESADEKGQALLEAIFILMAALLLLIGLGTISKALMQSHQSLVGSRALAFQKAFQAEKIDTFSAYEDTVNAHSSSHAIARTDTLPDDEIRQALGLNNKGIVLADWPPQGASQSAITHRTVLLVGSYAENSLPPSPPEAPHPNLFPQQMEPVMLKEILRSVEVTTISPPLFNDRADWGNVIAEKD